MTPSGGAGVMMASLLQHLKRSGWEVDVALRGAGLVQTVEGAHVSYYDTDAELLAILADSDVMITHLGGTPAAKRASRKTGLKVVQLVHNTSEYSVGFLGAGCDLAVYNSEWVSAYHYTRRESRLVKSWQGDGRSTVNRRVLTHWPSIVVRPPATEPRARIERPDDGYVTLVSMVPNKGPEIFYALAEANPRLPFMGVRGGYEAWLEDIRQTKNVRIHPHTRDMASVYKDTSVILMPSKYESYGLVAVEAMARGIPVIATDTPGLRECAGERFVVPERTVTAFQTRLDYVLSHYGAMSKLAGYRYDELYAQTKIDLKLFEHTLKELIDGDVRTPRVGSGLRD